MAIFLEDKTSSVNFDQAAITFAAGAGLNHKEVEYQDIEGLLCQSSFKGLTRN
jgi:hypothetical protein